MVDGGAVDEEHAGGDPEGPGVGGAELVQHAVCAHEGVEGGDVFDGGLAVLGCAVGGREDGGAGGGVAGGGVETDEGAANVRSVEDGDGERELTFGKRRAASPTRS